ncbi:MAG: tetratricopeptide repeat protein [Actinobacteria bacterium]|nr:tetratricopeptide repeat protein [Actinomycetota bacterium]
MARVVSAPRHYQLTRKVDLSPLRLVTVGSLAGVVLGLLGAFDPAGYLETNLGYVQTSRLLSAAPLGEHLLGADGETRAHGENAGWLWLRVLRQAAEGDYRGAEQTSSDIVRRDSGRRELALYSRGQSRMKQGNEEGAVVDWEQAGAVSPIMELAMRKAQVEQWQGAAALLERAIASSPGAALPHRELGWALHKGLAETDRAVGELELAIRLAPQDTHTYRLIARVLLDAGRYDEAKMWSENLLQRFPESAEANVVRGTVAYWVKEWDVAEFSLSAATTLAPNNSEAWFLLGQTYAQLQQHERAVRSFRTAISLDHGKDWYWSHLIALELKQGCRVCAVGDLEKAVELFPGNLEFSRLLLGLRD